MHKHSTVILLGILVVFLSAYILWDQRMDQKRMQMQQAVQNSQQQEKQVTQTPVEGDMSAPDGGSIKFYPNEYVLIPELEIGFRKVPGLTIQYTVEHQNAVKFTSEELRIAAQKSPALAYCATDGFSSVVLSTIPRDQAEFQGYAQKKLADGRYVNIYGPGAVCYTDSATQKEKDLANNQASLFNQFINSVQSY